MAEQHSSKGPSPSRATRAQLEAALAEVERLKAALQSEQDNARGWRDEAAAASRVVVPLLRQVGEQPEAVALAACIAALEELRRPRDGQGTLNIGGATMYSHDGAVARTSSVGRVLLHLAARFNIDLIEPVHAEIVEERQPRLVRLPAEVADAFERGGF